MYCLMNKIKVNRVNMILEYLFKVGKKLEYFIPYVILLSQFIEYFEIDVETKIVEEIKALNQITTANLTKIGLKKMKIRNGFAKLMKIQLVMMMKKKRNLLMTMMRMTKMRIKILIKLNQN